MSVRGDDIPAPVAVWFGLLGAPLAWVVQFLVGFGVDLAQCDAAGTRWTLPVDGWTLAATVGAALVAVAAILTAGAVFRSTRDAADAPPPASRVRFLAVIGLTIGPLFLAIILMSGFGAASLEACHQS